MATSTTRRDFLRAAAVAASTPALSAVTACTPDLAAPAASTARTDPDLQADLEEALERHNVVGANAAIFHDGRIRTAASGLINTVTGVTMTPRTVMHIGSITKIFNTTMLMQLVDDGLVDLDTPVSEYLPELRLRDPEHLAAITVKMLVNHTSGIDGEIMPDHGHDQEIIERAIPRFADMGKIHEPGQDFSYCNTATVIAGYLSQKLRGESWYDQVKDRIFRPLGMEHAVALPEDALLHRASVGHFLDANTGEHTRTSFAFLPVSFAPAGATLMMSAGALVTFAAAHMADGVGRDGTRILSVESAQLMRTPTIRYRGLDRPTQVGLGWMMPGGRWHCHRNPIQAPGIRHDHDRAPTSHAARPRRRRPLHDSDAGGGSHRGAVHLPR